MSGDAGVEIRAALAPLMRQDGGVIAAFGASKPRIYNQAPPASARSPFPYVTLGLMHVLAEPYEGIDSGDAQWMIHVWSRPDPRTTDEAAAIAGAVRDFLANLAPDTVELADFALVQLRWIDTQILEDPDGMTLHAVLRFEISYDPSP